MANVGKYAIHGAYGYCIFILKHVKTLSRYLKGLSTFAKKFSRQELLQKAYVLLCRNDALMILKQSSIISRQETGRKANQRVIQKDIMKKPSRNHQQNH